jgi:hypothetical protein
VETLFQVAPEQPERWIAARDQKIAMERFQITQSTNPRPDPALFFRQRCDSVGRSAESQCLVSFEQARYPSFANPTQRHPRTPRVARLPIHFAHELRVDHLSVAAEAEDIFHPTLQLPRQRQSNLRRRNRIARLDRAERLSAYPDGLGQIPLLHVQSLPYGLDRGANPGVHGWSIPEPAPHVNLT